MVEGWGEFTLWLNGQRVQTLSNGRTESYEPVSLAQLSPAALTALRPGHNVLAIEAVPASGKMRSKRETQEAASLDFGLVEINWQD
jgi:hypothetical protein